MYIVIPSSLVIFAMYQPYIHNKNVLNSKIYNIIYIMTNLLSFQVLTDRKAAARKPETEKSKKISDRYYCSLEGNFSC